MTCFVWRDAVHATPYTGKEQSRCESIIERDTFNVWIVSGIYKRKDPCGEIDYDYGSG